jgi:methylated-DNA-[protein]-cysteine S-methyltransferase
MSFTQQVYDACLKIPRGSVVSYSELARYINCESIQAVGQALKHNPNIPDVPCHRVVAKDGSLSGYAEGVDKKLERLFDEGIVFDSHGRVLPQFFTTLK